MLGQHTVTATVAVKDLAVARSFYSDTLGLTLVHEEGEGALTYSAGATSLFVYVSAFAGGNDATVATWSVGAELDALVKQLRELGVRFEHYPDLPDTKLEGDVHVAGSRRLAWFKDPDGNIHALGNA